MIILGEAVDCSDVSFPIVGPINLLVRGQSDVELTITISTIGSDFYGKTSLLFFLS